MGKEASARVKVFGRRQGKKYALLLARLGRRLGLSKGHGKGKSSFGQRNMRTHPFSGSDSASSKTITPKKASKTCHIRQQ